MSTFLLLFCYLVHLPVEISRNQRQYKYLLRKKGKRYNEICQTGHYRQSEREVPPRSGKKTWNYSINRESLEFRLTHQVSYLIEEHSCYFDHCCFSLQGNCNIAKMSTFSLSLLTILILVTFSIICDNLSIDSKSSIPKNNLGYYPPAGKHYLLCCLIYHIFELNCTRKQSYENNKLGTNNHPISF